MPRQVRIAILLAFLGHGFFIITARYRLSYDAYTHMLFANHYAENWFSLWEARWYTGFTVVSYPPLVHQLIALFIPVLGFDKAFALILWLVASLYPLGIYAFSCIFTGKSAAAYASLVSALLLPIYVTAHIFGQLPFLTSTLLALFSAASLSRYLREGGLHNFLLTILLYTTTMAAHHATLLVQPFLIFAVLVHHWLIETMHQDQRKKIIIRFILFAGPAFVTSLVVIFPFWQWGVTQIIQTPIDHLSRHNFLVDPLALAIFFFPLYGPLLFLIPFLIRKWPPRFIGLLVAFSVLFLLGLGGTTSLPHILFGNSWEWLTYDRFAFWACLTLTPFFGILFIGLKKKLRLTAKPTLATLRRNLLSAAIFSFFTVTSLGAWFTPLVFPLQPDPVDMRPLVDFLNVRDRSYYRYLTFGFGDQFAYLNLLTKATTIDGSYHTARTLPVLRESGLGQIDTSYWALNGMSAIKPILKESGEYGVRWGFVNPATLKAIKVRWGVLYQSPFTPVLEELGWVKIKKLSNGVLVYENPGFIFPQPSNPPKTKPFIAFAWGTFPILALVSSLTLGTLRIWPLATERVIRTVYSLTIALIPISLCFWFYQTVMDFPYPRVYFNYTDALFFFSDALVLLAVILWTSIKLTCLSKNNLRPSIHFQPLSFTFSAFTLFLLSSISILWSRDWRTSLYISLHLWLLFLFIFSLRDWHQVWKMAIFGLCAALTVEILTGYIGFALQSTAFLEPLKMSWPGNLEPSMRGASVVQLADGLRVLRAYGTLPHPNILGGVTLVALLGPANLFFAEKKLNHLALILFSLGIILVILTFSRSAWLGLLTFLIILVLKYKHFDRTQLVFFVLMSILTITLALYPLKDLLFTRVSNAPVATEQISTFGRFWLNQQAWETFLARPLTGVGVGAFVIHLSTYAIDGAIIEPVHNLVLLIASELGLFGILILLWLFVTVAKTIYKARSTNAILASATLAGLAITSLFDHYLWSLAPGRTLLALTLGLWIGQIAHDA